MNDDKPMTVGELIIKLKEYADETPVKIEALTNTGLGAHDDCYEFVHHDVGSIDKVWGLLVIRLN